MIFSFSLLVLAWTVAVVGAAADDNAREVRYFDSLMKNCRFTLEGQRFDLCPVFEENKGIWKIEYEYATPPTLTKTTYMINLRGALQNRENVSSYNQCPDGSWVCMIMTNRRWNDPEEPRVLQVIPVSGTLTPSNRSHWQDYYPGLNFTAELTKNYGNPDSNHEVLRVRLHGGYYVRQHQRADLLFVCDHGAEEPTQPTSAWTWGGTHAFQWKTKHACSRTRNAPAPEPTPEPEPEPEPQPPMPGPSDGDTPSADPPQDDPKDFSDPDLISRRSRQSMMTIFFSTAFIITVLAYLAYFPPRRLRQFATRYVKSHPALMSGRVGEAVLVRWADEDFVLENGEEDIMINASEMFDALDEQIPLKPSPRSATFAPVNYGTQ